LCLDLVMCLTNGWSYAARDFGLPRGASDAHITPALPCTGKAAAPGFVGHR